mmetsp:Transcript_62730/g.198648  ORF Transcript_62730/g.198648 Transcript_62730/m.198648 type:complete len:132 (+) Transcript_62730:1300-1695(+)
MTTTINKIMWSLNIFLHVVAGVMTAVAFSGTFECCDMWGSAYDGSCGEYMKDPDPKLYDSCSETPAMKGFWACLIVAIISGIGCSVCWFYFCCCSQKPPSHPDYKNPAAVGVPMVAGVAMQPVAVGVAQPL